MSDFEECVRRFLASEFELALEIPQLGSQGVNVRGELSDSREGVRPIAPRLMVLGDPLLEPQKVTLSHAAGLNRQQRHQQDREDGRKGEKSLRLNPAT